VSRRWAGAGRENETGREKEVGCGKLDQKSLGNLEKSLKFLEVELQTKSNQIQTNSIRNLILEHNSIQK
jgi:hypothetical protein